jgi:hypothetical protein
LATSRATDSLDKMTDAAGMLESPAGDANTLLLGKPMIMSTANTYSSYIIVEIRQLDQSIRDDLSFIANTKVILHPCDDITVLMWNSERLHLTSHHRTSSSVDFER